MNDQRKTELDKMAAEIVASFMFDPELDDAEINYLLMRIVGEISEFVCEAL